MRHNHFLMPRAHVARPSVCTPLMTEKSEHLSVLFSPCVLCSSAPNWKVISVSGSTFPTSLSPLCPASLSPFIRLDQMSTTCQRSNTLRWIEGRMWKGGAHSDLGSSNVTVQHVAIVLLSMICSNSWCSLLGLATTTYNTYTRLTTSTMGSMDIHVRLCEGGALLSLRCGQRVSPAHQADSRSPL